MPLVVYNFDIETEQTISTPVSVLDIYATVLELAGAEIPDNSPSRSLLDPEPRPVLTERFGFNHEGFENIPPGLRDAAERYDRYLRGVATKDDFSYEIINGVKYDGDDGTGRLDTLDAHFEDLETWDITCECGGF